jgi:hypothetical protein
MFPGDEKKRLIKWDCNIEIFKNVKEYNWDYVGKLTEL